MPAAAMTRCSAGRSPCMPCAASPPMPTASRPAASCISCRSCSAPSMCRAAFATRRRFRSPRRPASSPPASRARSSPTRRCPVRRSGFVTAPEDLLVDDEGRPQRIDKAYSLGSADGRPWPHAHGHRQCGQARSLRHRRALPVHGQYELELGHECAGHARLSDRQGRGDRRISHSEDHLFRCLCLGDGALRRSHPARHHLSRALGLHLAARPADLGSRWPGRFDPPAGGRARPRRARLPDRAARSGREARPARHDPHRRHAALSRRLSRLHRQSRARARPRAARRLSRPQWQGARPRRAQSRAACSAISTMAATGSTNCPIT